MADDISRHNLLKALGDGGASLTPLGDATDEMLTTARSSDGGRVGDRETASLFARTARLRRLDDFLGGADTYRLYVSELRETTKFVRAASCTDGTRQALTCVIAEQAQLAGWAAFDAGMHANAKQHYMTSLAAANEAENAALLGNSLAFLAYQRASTDKPSVEMATASYAIAEHEATPRVLALLLERLAWTHAVAGHGRETEAALQQAAEALHSNDDRPEPDWVFWVDADEIEIMAGRCWTELKRPWAAVPTLESVLTRYEDAHARDKSMYLTWLADAYLDADEVEQSATVTSRAIHLATGVASVRPMHRIGKVVQRLKQHRGLPSVAVVLDQIKR